MTGAWEPEVAAIKQLIAAYPEEYARLLSRAEAEHRRRPSCFDCAYLGPADQELADLLGHDSLGHRVLHRLQDYGEIHNVTALRTALDNAPGLSHLRGHGRGDSGLHRIHTAPHLLDHTRQPPA